MDGTDRMLTLIVRNHELLRLAAETRGRSRETIAAAERAALMAVRHAVLCAAAAGSWEAVRPSRALIRRFMANKE